MPGAGPERPCRWRVEEERVQGQQDGDRTLVTCLGEPLALVARPGAGDDDAAAPPDLTGATLAGAEANVAAGLAGAGVPVAYVSRVGADPAGRLLREALAGRGVDVGALGEDPGRPTGWYAKETLPSVGGEPASRMHYRRAGSAASAMGPDLLDEPAVAAVLARSRLVHTSGITPALSPACAALVHALVRRPRRSTATVSFDVNWREQLWPDGDPAPVVELAGAADVVLVGGDEAERVFGTQDPAALRRQLPGPRWIVLKDGARRALAIDRDGSAAEQEALRVDVVEPVGAGDAFAAGFLAGLVQGEDVLRCLRRGHVSAAAVLTVPGDSAPVQVPATVDRLLAAPAADWRATSVGADGFRLPVPAVHRGAAR
jgi:2-dehydro-3-deoxygluconokinase